MLFEDDPFEGITSPLQYRYMRLLKTALKFLGGWPGEQLGESMTLGRGYTFYNAVISFVCLVLGWVYLNENSQRLAFYEAGHMYLMLLMNTLSLSRAVILSVSKKYWRAAVKFIKEIHLFHHKHTSEFSTQIYRKVHRISHVFSIYLICDTLFCWVVFNVTPMYNNYSLGKYEMGLQGNLVNTTYELAVYFWMPFDCETNFNGYIWYSIFVWYVSFICGSFICIMDLFLSLMIFDVWGHFKILIHELQSLPKPGATRYMYSRNEMVHINDKLKECILYHHFIIRFTNEISEVFGVVLLIYLSYYQVGGCLMLLECSQMNVQALVRYVPLTALMFQQLTQVSLIFEIIGTVSSQLKDEVYSVPWERMGSEGRGTVLVLLMNVQEPVHVKAGGLVNVGVTTMASIMKTSFSYFAFLRTVNH